MLDRFQRQTVEAIRLYRGRISITLLDAKDEELKQVVSAFRDDRFSKDIALALQGYYSRQNGLKCREGRQ